MISFVTFNDISKNFTKRLSKGSQLFPRLEPARKSMDKASHVNASVSENIHLFFMILSYIFPLVKTIFEYF